MLCNLRAEMARRNISNNDLAMTIGKTDRSIRDKIRGLYEFSLPEAALIRNRYFPGMSLEYLFAEALDENDPNAR